MMIKEQLDRSCSARYLPPPVTLFGSLFTVVLLWLGLPGGAGLWPLLPVACVPLFLAVFGASWRQTVVLALFCGVGHFLVQLYWLVFVLGHYGGLPLYLSLPALLMLCFYMATYLLVFALVGRLFFRRLPPSLSLWLVPCLWVALEWLRSLFFTAFPWMDLGYGFADVPRLFQSADLWGHHGLSFLLVLFNTFVTYLILGRFRGRAVLRPAVSVGLLLLLTVAYSGWRWQQMDASLKGAETMEVAVVQGNVDQGQKWDPARQRMTVMGYLQQSRELMKRTSPPALLVWPETALPFYPLAHPLLAPIADFLGEGETMLLTGAPWYTRKNMDPGSTKFYNSSLLFNARGKIVARTSKSHLVPFGEFVPLKNFLPFIAPLIESVGDFVPGKVENPPACQKARIGVLICFESIFPDISRKWVDAGANLLVNITNDAWYGRSSAPYQTLAMTRLRAVETRRSIVRSANTGFSVFIDPMGRLRQLSPLFEPWTAVETVTIVEELTPFVRGGYLFAPGCAVVACAAALLLWRRRSYKNIIIS